MKKQGILLVIAIGILMLLCSCGSKQGGKDSAHPYSWKEKKNGCVRLTIKNAPEDGFAWEFCGTEDGLVSVTQNKETKKKTVFSITGEGVGGGTVTFTCRRKTAPFDAGFRITMVVTTDEEKLTVVSTEYAEYSSGSAGEEGKPSCIWYTTEENETALFIPNTEDSYEWEALSYDASLVSVEGPKEDENGCTYRIAGAAAGETSLLLCDTASSYGFTFALKIDKDLAVSVSEGEAGTVAVDADEIPGMDAVTTVVGELTLPEGASLVRCDSGNWYDAGEADYASLTIQMNQKQWSLIVTKTYTSEELAEMCAGELKDVTRTDTAVGERPAVLCTTDSEQMLFWEDGEGHSFFLSPTDGTGASQEELLTAAGLLGTIAKKGA